MNYQTKEAHPCAFITKNRQRLKQFGQNVYLKNGEEFEIELFNPLKSTILSKIKINGNYLSGGGLVIKPGQRIFLERYLDDAKKFKFETYEVDGSSKEVLEAISSNGDVIIEFYEENINQNLSQPLWINTLINYPSTTQYPYYGTTFTTTGGIGFDSSSVNYSSNDFLSSYNSNSTNTFEEPNKRDIPRSRSFAKKSKSIETGRVEKGSSSNQSFKSVNLDFNTFPKFTSQWKILPNSQKPIEEKDLIEKCPKCTAKIKKSSWKFCPNCGNQLSRTKTEIHYTNSIMIEHNGKNYMMQTYQITLDEFLKINENKLIYIKQDSLSESSLRAIVID